MVKNPASNAGDPGSIAGWGTKIPCANGQLSPRATTTEPALALEQLRTSTWWDACTPMADSC